MSDFAVERTDPLTLERSEQILDMYTLSPFVWRDGSNFPILLRLVPRRDEMPAEKISRIHIGTSEDGLHFKIEDVSVIAPGPEKEDQDGCEDPTLAVVGNQVFVYYSGWNETEKCGQMLLTVGPDARHLEKQGVKLASTAAAANPKEATLVPLADGTWRLFFEYAGEGASKIGLASAPAVDGPWSVLNPPFAARPGGWDGWHLSPGPMLMDDPERPVMFYNGATRETRWRIGWIAFDAECSRVVARSAEPMFDLAPPMAGDTDIAFAASCVETDDNTVWLYYSVADKDLFRATLRRS